MEQKQSAKEEYETKKAEREEKKEAARKKSSVAARADTGARGAKTFGFIIITILVIGGGIWFAVSKKEPLGKDFSQFFTSQGREHIDIGAEHPEYNSNPPSSGWHYSNPARTGFYDKQIADETLIHNLEHGEIWISYHPRVSDEVKNQLKDLANRYVIVTPREENETDIAVVSWTRVDAFNTNINEISESDIKRIKDFIKRYDNKGPENLRTAQHGRI